MDHQTALKEVRELLGDHASPPTIVPWIIALAEHPERYLSERGLSDYFGPEEVFEDVLRDIPRKYDQLLEESFRVILRGMVEDSAREWIYSVEGRARARTLLRMLAKLPPAAREEIDELLSQANEAADEAHRECYKIVLAIRARLPAPPAWWETEVGRSPHHEVALLDYVREHCWNAVLYAASFPRERCDAVFFSALLDEAMNHPSLLDAELEDRITTTLKETQGAAHVWAFRKALRR